MNNTYKKAFSMTEVIMATLIVGILAISTLPTLDKSYKRNIMQTNFADAIKTANSALYNYSARHACSGHLTCTDLFRAGSNSATLLSESFNNAIFTGTNCWDNTLIPNNITGKGDTTNLSALNCIKTGSDKIFAIDNFGNSCNTNISKMEADGITPQSRKLTRACGYLYVDVNGNKSPNCFGYDVFIFAITDNPQTYLYPVGGSLWQDTLNFNGVQDCNVNEEGRTCAGRIVEDNMKIRYFK